MKKKKYKKAFEKYLKITVQKQNDKAVLEHLDATVKTLKDIEKLNTTVVI